MSDDDLLIELTELLGDHVPSDALIDEKKSLDMVLEEMEDVELFNSRQNIVNADLLKFADAPELPSATQRMTMLDKLGNSLWYDRWQQERCEQVNDVEDIEMVTLDMTENTSSNAVETAMEKIQNLEDAKDAGWNRFEEYADEIPDEPIEEKMAEYDARFFKSEPIDLEMQPLMSSNDMVAPVRGLENHMIYYSIEEGSQPIPDLSIEALEAVAEGAPNFEWVPSMAELVAMGPELLPVAAGGVQALALYGLVEGLTPIVKSLIDTDWIRTPWLTEQTKQSVSQMENIMTYQLGDIKLIRKVQDFIKTPFYVWYFDTPDARIKNASQPYGPSTLWWSIKQTPCSNMWLRGRVVAIAGSSVGFHDMQEKLVMAVKITADETNTDLNDSTFWIDCTNAVMLRDFSKTTYAANTLNLARKLFKKIENAPIEAKKSQPEVPKLPKDNSWMDTSWQDNTSWGNTQTTFGEGVVIKPMDHNGSYIYTGDRVYAKEFDDFGKVLKSKFNGVLVNLENGEIREFVPEDLEIVEKPVPDTVPEKAPAKPPTVPDKPPTVSTEFHSSEWPFLQKKMKMGDPPTPVPKPEPIPDNPFNQFRRRLPDEDAASDGSMPDSEHHTTGAGQMGGRPPERQPPRTPPGSPPKPKLVRTPQSRDLISLQKQEPKMAEVPKKEERPATEEKKKKKSDNSAAIAVGVIVLALYFLR